MLGRIGKDKMSETPIQRRLRVAALVAARWPEPLPPNKFANTILDIVRGGFSGSPTDVLEAVDALTEMNLESLEAYEGNSYGDFDTYAR